MKRLTEGNFYTIEMKPLQDKVRIAGSLDGIPFSTTVEIRVDFFNRIIEIKPGGKDFKYPIKLYLLAIEHVRNKKLIPEYTINWDINSTTWGGAIGATPEDIFDALIFRLKKTYGYENSEEIYDVTTVKYEIQDSLENKEVVVNKYESGIILYRSKDVVFDMPLKFQYIPYILEFLKRKNKDCHQLEIVV